MSLEKLVEIIHSGAEQNWADRNKDAFEALFGAPGGRYPERARKSVVLRAPPIPFSSGVPFAAYIHPNNPQSGAYGGFSFVIFPVLGEPALIGFVVGTGGLAPDESILGRPGHARKAQAICSWLNHEFGQGKQIAWAKQDPTRKEVVVPESLQKGWDLFNGAFNSYGPELYALFRPGSDRQVTLQALKAFLDLMFEERGYFPNAAHRADRDGIRSRWFDHLMLRIDRTYVQNLLAQKHFVIIQGPPGTGKTTMASKLLKDEYAGSGTTVQFHPNTTYEALIGGLSPEQSQDAIGLQFRPKAGVLMRAAAEALKIRPKPYLLCIDEINRADLSKILGEAIYLLESTQLVPRQIGLPYDFGDPFHQTFFLPDNLHIVGTMNTADRSIAIVDVAVRRRFAFVSLWPQMSVVEQNGCELMQNAFKEILNIFVEHASEDAFNLVPGHSYFLETDDSKARTSLKVGLAPLLEEYLAQGYVGGFSEQIRSYLQWVRSL
jgi:5-methylcytosine-specific restriction protein B